MYSRCPTCLAVVYLCMNNLNLFIQFRIIHASILTRDCKPFGILRTKRHSNSKLTVNACLLRNGTLFSTLTMTFLQNGPFIFLRIITQNIISQIIVLSFLLLNICLPSKNVTKESINA